MSDTDKAKAPEGLDALSGFDFEFDAGLDIFGDDLSGEPTEMDAVPGADPGVFLPNTEGRSEFLPPDPDRVPVIDDAVDQHTPEYAARPAIERTKELFSYMYPHRATLFGILEAAREPLPHQELEERIGNIQGRKFSVYSAADLCSMLQTAGALELVAEDGTPLTGEKPQPKIVVIDGVEYYEPTRPPRACWKTTQAGLEMLALDKPAERLERQLSAEEDLLSIYKQVLLMCAAPDGATMAELSGAIDKDPLIAEPERRFFVQHFVEALERCAAIVWDGAAWRTRELGDEALKGRLAEVDSSRFATARAEDAVVATETQGINW